MPFVDAGVLSEFHARHNWPVAQGHATLWIRLMITQRRLRYLETLPENYDASPPTSSQAPGPNDLIDLKLS